MNDNKINVGGRLHSIATGNILTGADEVIDDAKGKKQSVVNAENDIQLASHESRLNAYTEGKFVTVNNYSALPATGAVDTIYRVSSWDGTANNGQGAVDVTKYSEYAWQNGAYKFLDVKTQIGEVFDISEYNSGAVYTDLANSLGTNGMNVPSSIRRGGMSVKFKQVITPAKYTIVKTEGATEQPTGTELQSDPGIVSGTYTAGELNVFSTLPATLNSSLTYYLIVTETVDEQEVTTYTTWVITYAQSSDNKYAQYRCMAQNFTTNVTQWQGVDDEPTAGSENLVKSGGVKGELDYFKSSVFGELELKPTYIDGKVFNKSTKNTTTVGNSWHCTDFVNIKGYDSLIINKASSLDANYRGITILGDNEVIAYYDDYCNADLTVYSNYAELYVVVNAKSSDATSIKVTSDNSLKDYIKQSINNTYPSIISKNNGIIKDLSTNFVSKGIVELRIWVLDDDFQESIEGTLSFLGYNDNKFYINVIVNGNELVISKDANKTHNDGKDCILIEDYDTGLFTHVYCKVIINNSIFSTYGKVGGGELFVSLDTQDSYYLTCFNKTASKENTATKEDCIAVKQYIDSSLYSLVSDYRTINNNPGVTVNGASYMANNVFAEDDGIISSIKFNSRNGKSFEIITATPVSSNGFKMIRKTTITPTKTGLQEIETYLQINKGDVLFFGQDGTEGQEYPGYTSNNSAVADNGGKWFWVQANVVIGNTYTAQIDAGLVCNATYKIISLKYKPIEQIDIPVVNYVTVTRNSANYNSIRETLSNITDASEMNQYVVIVPDGEWFECDLQGKKYVRIKGQSKNNTIIYCDGDSDNLTPSDYSYTEYKEMPLSSVPRINKHVIMPKEDFIIENVTIKAITAKYVIHCENSGWRNVELFNCKIIGNNLNNLVGFGLRGNQFFKAENCIFDKISNSVANLYVHNWTWASTTNMGLPLFGGGAKIYLKNCIFVSGGQLLTIGEIASMNNDLVIFESCNIDGTNKTISCIVEKSNGIPIAKDLNGNTISDPLNVPYCIQVNINKCGNVIVSGSTDRPNFSDMVTVLL